MYTNKLEIKEMVLSIFNSDCGYLADVQVIAIRIGNPLGFISIF